MKIIVSILHYPISGKGMTVIRRLDAVLEPTKEKVLEMKKTSTRIKSQIRPPHSILRQVRPFVTLHHVELATKKKKKVKMPPIGPCSLLCRIVWNSINNMLIIHLSVPGLLT